MQFLNDLLIIGLKVQTYCTIHRAQLCFPVALYAQ